MHNFKAIEVMLLLTLTLGRDEMNMINWWCKSRKAEVRVGDSDDDVVVDIAPGRTSE